MQISSSITPSGPSMTPNFAPEYAHHSKHMYLQWALFIWLARALRGLCDCSLYFTRGDVCLCQGEIKRQSKKERNLASFSLNILRLSSTENTTVIIVQYVYSSCPICVFNCWNTIFILCLTVKGQTWFNVATLNIGDVFTYFSSGHWLIYFILFEICWCSEFTLTWQTHYTDFDWFKKNELSLGILLMYRRVSIAVMSVKLHRNQYVLHVLSVW